MEKRERNKLFQQLKYDMEPNPKARVGCNSWVSLETWLLVDHLAVAQHQKQPNNVVKCLCHKNKPAFNIIC